MVGIALLLLSLPMSAETCRPALRGHVYERHSGLALSGVAVQAEKLYSSKVERIQGITDRDGFFEFPDLNLKDWWVRLSRTDGTWSYKEAHIPECGGIVFLISKSEAAERIPAKNPACKFSLRGYVYLHESFAVMPGHVVRATNGHAIATAVTNRNGYFEFLNLTSGNWWLTTDMSGYKPATIPQFATLREDTGCANRNLYLQHFGPREQLEEALGSAQGYALALFQLAREALGGR